jgi:hypothetical protein
VQQSRFAEGLKGKLLGLVLDWIKRGPQRTSNRTGKNRDHQNRDEPSAAT